VKRVGRVVLCAAGSERGIELWMSRVWNQKRKK